MMIADQVLSRGIGKYLLGVVFFCLFGSSIYFQNSYAACPSGSQLIGINPDGKEICANPNEKQKADCGLNGGTWTSAGGGTCFVKPPKPPCEPGTAGCKPPGGAANCDLVYTAGSQGHSDCIKTGGKGNSSKMQVCKDNGYSQSYCECKLVLKGIYLNTEVPFVGDPKNPRCLVMDTAASAPTTVLQSLTKILMTFVMIGGFGMIVWAGMLMASSGSDETRFKQGKDILIGVVIAFASLGSLGVILRLINPNFFT